MKILLAKPRGFCAGVDRAIDTVKLALEVYGKPLYVKHAIVHNEKVVKDLEDQGVIFIEAVTEIPKRANVVFSAHGSPPADYLIAKSRELNLIDATCPLVTKVHLEAKRFAKEGYRIILVGHKGHIELVGTRGEAPDSTIIVESEKDIESLNFSQAEKIVVLTQTTLSVDDTKGLLDSIKKKYPQVILPPSSDICYATTNRQRAARPLAEASDLVLVVGSAASSNTNRLVDVAKDKGTTTYRINGPEDIQKKWFKNVKVVGVTSGASAPEDLVQKVIDYLRQMGATKVEELEVMEERVWFDLPPEIKEAAQKTGAGHKFIDKHTISADSKMSA